MPMLTIKSIGRAGFSDCVELASRLELAPVPFIKSVYQAPFVVTLERPDGDHRSIQNDLRDRGFEIDDAIAQTEESKALYDVAVVLDLRRSVEPVLDVLSHFIGAPSNEILGMLLRPPSLVLGDVTKATVEALNFRLDGLSAKLLSSEKVAALYDLFLPELDYFTLQSIESAAGRKATPESLEWRIIKDLSFERANVLWRQFGHHAGVQIVNQDFQVWDIWLDSVPTEEIALDRLAQIAGIPANACRRIVKHLPIVIKSSVTSETVRDLQEKLTAESIATRAELATLRNFAVTLIDAPEPEKCSEIIAGFGCSIESDSLIPQLMPIVLPMPMPDIAARLMQKQLEQIQCRVELEVIAA
jgi:hypothetical protein